MGLSHFLFHPLGRTCLRHEECPIFTFPPSHFSSPHTLSTNTDFSLTLLPPLPLSQSLMERSRLSCQSCNVIPALRYSPSAIYSSRRCQKHFACDREPLRSNANFLQLFEGASVPVVYVLESFNNDFNMCDSSGRLKWKKVCVYFSWYQFRRFR